MTSTTTAVPYTKVASAPRTPASLDALLQLDVPALADLYAGARVPRLEDVKGDLRGRMLATSVLRGRVANLVRTFASSDSFPWRGKSFMPKGALRGDGINRVIRDRWHRAGDFDALQLDYDNRDNPFFIRPIKDEMRELSPGLWLGQAYLQLPHGAHLALYFGLAR